MTTSELDTQLLDELSQSSGNADYDTDIRYRILTRAYHHVCRNSWATWRGGELISTSDGDESFNLLTELSLSVDYIWEVTRCYYLVSGIQGIDLVKASLAQIKSRRSHIADPGCYPSIYNFSRQTKSSVKTPYLEIYAPVQDTGDVLYIDWIEKGADLTSSQDPISPLYADAAIVKWAAYFWKRSLGSRDAQVLLAEAHQELYNVRCTSFDEASHSIQSAVAR